MLTRSSLRLAHAHLILSTKNNAESSEKETGGRTFPMALQRCRRLVASATAVAVALALFVFALATPASAGDWKGRPHRLYTEEDYHLNHVPVPLLTKDKMPKEFSWANARGRHLLVRICFSFFFSSFFFLLLSSLFAHALPTFSNSILKPNPPGPLLEPARAHLLRLLLRSRHALDDQRPLEDSQGRRGTGRDALAPDFLELRRAQGLRGGVRRRGRLRRLRLHVQVRSPGRELPDLQRHRPHKVWRPESRESVPRGRAVQELHARERLRHLLGCGDADPVFLGELREGREQKL